MANEGCKCSSKVNHRAEDYADKRLSNAQVLGAYRRELESEGVDPDEIRLLVIEAGRHLLRDGGDLLVRTGGAGPFGGEVVVAK